MGTRFEVAIVCDDLSSSHATAVGELALGEIEDWHRRLTRFEADSWLAHVNRTAYDQPVRLDEGLFELVTDALKVWRESGGAFDIAKGDGDALVLDEQERTLRFTRRRLALDLGAIGKGHALDAAAAMLRQHGVQSAFLQGGTSSGVAIGRPPGLDSWRVGMSKEEDRARVTETCALVDAAFSLSDEASQPDAPLGRHIVDPRTGAGNVEDRPARRVLVTGPSARLADAWSTALAVIGSVPAAFPASYTARFLRE